ncbi:MAG: SusC/RagA family TonB-linked outer membrane protein, partial [Chitinophagaceae bacterium]
KVIGSIAQVGAKEIENRPVTQLQNVLTGQLAGVTVTQRSGRPGTASGAISVRGVGSFGASADALILVDGIPVGGFNDINPNDVETISVLKDASSAAIYGSRAANGVVLVTTKSGKAGKTQVSYSGYTGFQQPTALPQFVNSWEYQQAVFEATNATASATGVATLTPEQLAIVERFKAQNDVEYPNTNFINSVITKKGVQTGHSVMISGGTESNKYNLSLGYLFQDGLVVDNNYSRYNLRLNLNTTLSPKFDLTTRISSIVGNVNEPYVPSGVNNTNLTDIIDQAIRVPGNFVGRYPNGDFGLGINLFGTPVSYLASQSFFKQKGLNLSGNTRLDYKAFRGFKTSFIASYVQNTGRETRFRSTQRLNSVVTLGPNQLNELTNNNYYYTVQGLAEYTKQFQRHQMTFLAGYSFEKNTAENFNAYRDNLPGNDLSVLAVGSPGNQQSNGSGTEFALESQFARANYSYANKYLIEGVIRRDGSSKFPTNNKYAYFPSVAVGWRLGQENFVKDNMPWINELKIKASRGVLGNQNLGNNYPYQNTLVTSGANNGGTLYSFGGTIAQGVTRNRITDPNLRWESTRTTDVGIEAGLFKNKLTFSSTYFDRFTYDILYSPGSSVSNVLGFQLSPTNTGKLKNSGIEVTL